ncbi:MAG: hypothetical protein A3E36_01020 [Candidatus Andersenbacteria bacterium RIFCSPHIGHO2_12_FULL_45_11b]|uniref:Uncharacterized protein n=1 Tax=Candidatus Andersenbacteria bacterium RIFCSPHIGHO2_12_FULL_45_11b TaxID=1797282 RepID=A0A1G1XBH3_9BACT|nr:MAG: hypothetical protein A3E36_01020 [Candidatus Andersenbacteria bacterium RIFCSPHIGHO2_12_FULL_45_11b]
MHTQEFIEEMKKRLEDERAQLNNELQQDSHVADGELQANYPEYGRSEEENVAEMEDYQALVATTTAVKQRLAEVEDALDRIHTNTYGVTEYGADIPEDRLRANPAATTVIV